MLESFISFRIVPKFVKVFYVLFGKFMYSYANLIDKNFTKSLSNICQIHQNSYCTVTSLYGYGIIT